MNRPTSNPAAVSRPGVGETENSRWGAQISGPMKPIGPKPLNYGAPKFETFQTYNGEGASGANGLVLNKQFNGQAPGRKNPNQKVRYESAKHLREFTGF